MELGKKIKYRVLEHESVFTDKREMEKLIFFLSADEITVFLLRHIGYHRHEIIRIMGLSGLSAYNKISRSLGMRIYLFKNLYKDTNDFKEV